MSYFPVWSIDQCFQEENFQAQARWISSRRTTHVLWKRQAKGRKEEKNEDRRSGRKGEEGWWGPSKSMVAMVVVWTVSWPQLHGSVVRAFRVTILRLPLFPSFPSLCLLLLFYFCPTLTRFVLPFVTPIYSLFSPVIFYWLPTSTDLVLGTLGLIASLYQLTSIESKSSNEFVLLLSFFFNIVPTFYSIVFLRWFVTLDTIVRSFFFFFSK